MSSWTFTGEINGHGYIRNNVPNSEVLANESGQRVQVGPNEFEQFSGSVQHNPNSSGTLSINGIAHMTGNFNVDLTTVGTLTPN